jgi:hypothetical protein
MESLYMVIDEYADEAILTATPLTELRDRIVQRIARGQETLGYDGEEVTPENFELHVCNRALDEWEDFTGFLLIPADSATVGPKGVALGFSSADRQSFAFPWPQNLHDGEFYGNGDPVVYDPKVIGVPVKGRTVT